MLISRYPETVNLTYNHARVSRHFTIGSPREAAAAGGCWVALTGGGVLLESVNGRLGLPRGGLPGWLEPLGEPLTVGSWKGEPLRVFTTGADGTVPSPFVWEPFSTITPRADETVISVCGLARQILNWERRSRFCSSCGGGMEWHGEHWSRRCRSCGARQFPAACPCAIVLVRRGREVLMIHKPEWTDGRYSIPSGFLDLGESAEECALREVREETGIEVRNLQYVGSQNWPFPASLMSGFVAEYAGGEIRIQESEIDDARWFPVDRLPTLPSRRSIARWIIDNYARLGY